MFTATEVPGEEPHGPVPAVAGDAGGGEESVSRYPAARIRPFSDVAAILELAAPGIRHPSEEHPTGGPPRT
ncbi:hypothetical protein GCM10022419_037030 [Nonomuraea rosea]|uniref:Uncharacterized protein n=1 Tax=Nonomuraea rosea TaxID=638574 RepID=A0ABP6WPY3_9ACTN